MSDVWQSSILDQLTRDARHSMRQLGAAIGLSPSAVAERVRRLEDLGVIRGYKADIDYRKLGWTIEAFVTLSARDGRCDLLLSKLEETTNVTAAYHIAGEVDYLARIVAGDLEELKSITDNLAEYAAVSSLIVLGTAFERNPRPLGRPQDQRRQS